MKMKAMPRSRRRPLSRLMTWAWIDTSRAETGSSAMMTCGSTARGRRCRCAGAGRRENSGRVPVEVPGFRPTREQVLDPLFSLLLGQAVDLQRGLDDRADRLARVERAIGSWKIICSLVPERAKLTLADRRHLGAPEEDRSRGRAGEADDRAAQSGLSAAGLRRPGRGSLSGIQVQVHAVDGLDDLATTEQSLVVSFTGKCIFRSRTVRMGVRPSRFVDPCQAILELTSAAKIASGLIGGSGSARGHRRSG